MSETTCMLCKNITGIVKYNIDQDYTKCSNSLLRTVLESVFDHRVILTGNLHVCHNCSDLLNELDVAENSYKRLRQKVLGYLDYTYDASRSNAYSQTDVFLENVLEYDLQGKPKVSEEVDIDDAFKWADVEGLNNEIKEELKYDCNICGKKFISKSGVGLHIKRQHSHLHKDAQTEIVTLSDIVVQPKVETNVNDDPSEQNALNGSSDNCDENISDVSDHQSESKKPHRSSRGRKKKHPGILKPYQCTSCPKTWKTLGELKSHLSAHSDVRPFICEICGQAYKHKTALDIHVGMHNGIYPFRCTYCKKSFTQKGALQRHMPIHTGETPYQCDLCGKRFVHHTSFNIHQLSHSGQKDYKCAQCGLALLSGSHLKRHMRVHTGERNYACNLCDKRFAERYNLASHQKLHEKPTSNVAFKRNHRCQICGTTYNRRLKLDEHMARDHQKIIETNVPFVEPLFTKNDAEPIWPTVYNNLKADIVPEASY